MKKLFEVNYYYGDTPNTLFESVMIVADNEEEVIKLIRDDLDPEIEDIEEYKILEIDLKGSSGIIARF